MKKSLYTIAILLTTVICKAQDALPADSGEIRFHPIFHGTLAIEYNDLTIYIDPYNGASGFSGLPKPDLVLITHTHPDHLDRGTLTKLPVSESNLISPEDVAAEVADLGFKEILTLKNGGVERFQNIVVQAVPMYSAFEGHAYHLQDVGNGYLLTIGGKRIYISGDSEGTAEMRGLEDIDVAFICMNLPYTMPVEEAADAVLDQGPKVVYPYHYRNQDGSFANVEKFKELVNSSNSGIDVRIRDWYAK